MKLYWRIKIDGKWTYKAAKVVGHYEEPGWFMVEELKK